MRGSAACAGMHTPRPASRHRPMKKPRKRRLVNIKRHSFVPALNSRRTFFKD